MTPDRHRMTGAARGAGTAGNDVTQAPAGQEQPPCPAGAIPTY
ncbi:hypothetical protein ACFU7T_03675 [Streptomyces sp. NPDC057555]